MSNLMTKTRKKEKGLVVPKFVNEHAEEHRKQMKERKIREQAISNERKEHQEILEAKRKRKIFASMSILSIVGIVAIMYVLVGFVMNMADELPKKISAPDGYVKVYDEYRIHYGDTVNGITYEILEKNNLSDYYRFQDLKAEIMRVNKKSIINANRIKSGSIIKVPRFEVDEDYDDNSLTTISN